MSTQTVADLRASLRFVEGALTRDFGVLGVGETKP